MASLGTETLTALEPNMQWLFLPGGEPLIMQGDPGDSMYIVVNGRLRYFIKNPTGEIVAEGDFSRGDIIGEMALLTGESRSASVFATRGCELVRFSTEVFEGLISKNPSGMLNITRTIALRLKGETGNRRKKRNIKVVTLLPLYDDLPYSEFSRKLLAYIEKGKSVYYADKKSFYEHHVAQKNKVTAPENMIYDIADLFAWFYQLEDSYDMVLIIADPKDKLWTETSLKHTDKIYLIADHKCVESLYPVEIRYLYADQTDTSPDTELILLYDVPGMEPVGTALKLSRRKVSYCHHIRMFNDNDFARLARSFMSRSIGLALGGGGAKGFAHIGLIRAFLEEGIPIDIIGGTSAGSIMGALFGLGYDVDKIEAIARKIMADQNNLNDYTFPLVSLIRGGKYTSAIQKVVGDKKIEDMWIPYFAVATNLTLAEKKVFLKSDLWKAIRASTSLPGIMPPLYSDGSVYVDGALLDNIPGSVLKDMGAGLRIAVSLDAGDRKERDQIFSEVFDERREGVAPSVLQVLKMKINPRFRKKDIPAMGNLIMRATMVNSLAMAYLTQKEVDLFIELPVGHFSIFGWKDFDRIVQAGYDYAKAHINEWKTQLGL